MRKSGVFIALMFSPLVSAEDRATWVPVVDFTLESSSYEETLHWISGNSYAYSSVTSEMERENVFCTDSVGSEVLLDILNTKYRGKSITSEQASNAFIKELPMRFPCE